MPLLAVAWIAGIGFGRTETGGADRRLETEARAAAAVFIRSVREADRRAAQLASSRALQQALATRDRAAVEKLVRPGEVVYAGNTRFVASGERSGLDFSHGLLSDAERAVFRLEPPSTRQ